MGRLLPTLLLLLLCLQTREFSMFQIDRFENRSCSVDDPASTDIRARDEVDFYRRLPS